MTTMDGLIDECLLNLTSYGLIQPRVLRLSLAVDTDDTTFTLSDTRNVETGMAEIEQELVYVLSIDRTLNTAEVIRGYLSTVSASHAAGVAVVANPPWPRAVVASKINDAITGAYPDLFVVGTTTLSSSAVVTTYDLDPSVELVREVEYQLIGPSLQWKKVRQFWFDPTQSKLTFDQPPYPNSDVLVTYQRRPIEIATTGALTDSGLSQSAKRYVVLKACADLVSFMDASRLPVAAAAADDMDANRQITTATNVARILLSLAEIEKQAERKRMQVQYKPTVHKAKAR